MRTLLVALAAGLLSVAALACSSAPATSAEPSPPAPSDDSELRYLVERIFSGPHLTGNPELLPGQLPPDFDINLPEGTKIVGSVLATGENGDDTAQVILDVPGEPQAVLASLTSALAEVGWKNRDESGGNQGGGFISSLFGPLTYALFCSEVKSSYRNVSAFPLGDGLTDIRLNLVTNAAHSPCDQEPGISVVSGRGNAPFPPLTAPAGVRQTTTGSGAGSSSDGGRNFHTESELDGPLSAEQVEAHYREQLTEAGWTLLDNNTAGPSAWSTWRFTDDEGEIWGAMLLVLKTPEADNSLFAFLRASN